MRDRAMDSDRLIEFAIAGAVAVILSAWLLKLAIAALRWAMH
jgi:hypothetical protein